MTRPATTFIPPRVLIVMRDQWPRALLRAALRESGYDAVGTRSLTSALRIRPTEAARGPVRLLIVDHAEVRDSARDTLARLLTHHGRPRTLLLARRTVPTPGAGWDRVLLRPMSIDDIVGAARQLIPLPPEDQRPLA